jgi:hypothetical protein
VLRSKDDPGTAPPSRCLGTGWLSTIGADAQVEEEGPAGISPGLPNWTRL